MITEKEINRNEHRFIIEPIIYQQEFMYIEERIMLCYLAAESTGNILEIGCNKGITTRMLALNNLNKTIYGVDFVKHNNDIIPQDYEKPSEIGLYTKDCNNVILIDQDSRTINYDDFNNVDLIFLDGNHTYDFVKADSEKALEYLMKRGSGIIAWHDYTRDEPWIGVIDYIDEYVAPFHELTRVKNLVFGSFKY